ncbi:MAG: FadR family transcriptional regulator [Acidimicrobiia bacterium]|nr:FadR family transcriptional regulator [Acidimicrobiia bacterium]
MSLTPIERQTASGAIFDQIAEEIVRGRLDAGTALPAERLLSEQFGVSRPAVREALQRLAQVGLVEIRHGDATRVRDYRDASGFEMLGRLLFSADGGVDTDVVRSVLEMRLAIGADAARRCAQRATPEIVDALQETLDAMVRADSDLHELQRLDLSFWSGLIDGSRNIAYRLAFNGMREAYEPVGSLLTQVLEAELRNHGARNALVAAIVARGDDAAEAAARQLLSSSASQWEAALGPDT